MPKRLVVCCDGTWNVPDKMDRGMVCPSNVAKTALAVPRLAPDGTRQLIYYGAGVGTGKWDRIRGGLFGWGLSSHVLDAYRFIVEQFEDGDELYLFGFSRGAFTARSMAGLIGNCGVLRREYIGKIDAAYKLYRRRDDASHPRAIEAELFRKSFSWEPTITFLGVWDTVGALGIPGGIPWLPVTWLQFLNRPWSFHDTKLSRRVEHAYHAVAIDEHRPQFAPTLWEQQEGGEQFGINQQMEQVWFSGVHSNIGGGYQDSGLSDIAFLWMKQKAEACGLAFQDAYIAKNVHPNALGELRNSKVGLYAGFRDHHRPIGRQDRGNESVHPSALERMDAGLTPVYEPKTLRSYRAQHERVTA